MEVDREMRSVGVAVCHPDPGVVDEVIHAVEATQDLVLALDPAKASVVVAGAGAMRSLADEPAGAGVALIGLAVDGDLPDVARTALRCGAEDILCWPRDRETLRTTVREAASRARLAAGTSAGKVVAVVGARGGAGTSTIAAMLGRGLADSVVVDLDTTGGGQSLFMPADAEPTLERVLDVVEELDPVAFRSALSKHASGWVLCAPVRRDPPGRERVERLLALLRASAPYAVIDAGRAADAGARAATANADTTLCVCAPDLQSLRGARALATAIPGVRFVLNMATRLRVSARDVTRVLGSPPIAVVPLDPAMRRSGEAAKLAPRGPGKRALDRLLNEIMKGTADGS
ncbi:MAG: AAA family ATPase [Actinomycetota bacterium]